ncbi:alpha/beta hydrolase [Amycolatopsis cihanbeyliensis]|uniref:S-formylglutathione hydrolase FrmB n=1 Tax=Amycolatopsis cihanbeyliensis TaxID=1128664 RepID=A0A542DMH2_AMYCI|nr:alpha/beta hydrolase-fold protein [Amycolatopsis cihanbeyliensis]TQJ04290.1 S-formylglutathione hydrolase FrmB [Amycolatopsis cihanbeyliensis]
MAFRSYEHPAAPRRARWRRALSVVVALVATLIVAPAPVGAAAQPTFTSGHGIEVRNVLRSTPRSYVVNIHTGAVDTRAIAWDYHDVIVTLPEGYNPALSYPVLYLFHGRGQGPGAWHNEADVEGITRGFPFITVTAEAGKAGWATNWVNQSAGVQQWDTFHLDQLVPWIDQNLNTIREREGRAIAGFSMGAFAAIRHATHRPGLFRFAAGFSGGYNLEDVRMRTAVTGSMEIEGFPLDGPFGAPGDGSWAFNNPQHRVGALSGVHTVLYGGTQHGDPLEAQAHRLSYEFHQHLLANGITNSWFVEYDCAHNIHCAGWQGLRRELPVMRDVLWDPR